MPLSEVARRLTRQDFLFSALIAFLLTISPMTGSAVLWRSAILGVAGGLIVFAVRVFRRWREPASPRIAPVATARRWPSPLVIAALAVTGLAFAPALRWLFEQHTDTLWRNVHGLFLPLFAYLLARSALRGDPEPARFESSPWGFALLVPGLALSVIDAGVRSHYLAALGFVLALPGLSLLFLGARRTRRIAVPLVLCAFVLPIPPALADPFGINAVTSVLADHGLAALRVVVLRHETVFITRVGVINVSQNCSGLAVLYAGAALSFVLAYAARGRARRILIPLLVYPLTAISNAARVVGIVVLMNRIGSEFLFTPLHGLSGLLVLWFVLGCLWLCADHAGLREKLA